MKLSIIVPTINGAETLAHTLRTIVEQEDPNFEIIVLDNCGSPDNLDVVESFSRPDIFVYKRNSKRLRMADNWESALSLTSGDYITILGDDDGLVLGSLSLAREAIEKTKPDILFWWPHMFWWPDALLDHKKSLLYINRGQKRVEKVEPQLFIENFFGENGSIWNFEKLPSIYNGFVSRGLIKKITESCGRYFCDENPDCFSGVANALFSSNSIFIHWPLSVRGLSGNSNGVAHRANKVTKSSLSFDELATQEISNSALIESKSITIGIESFKLRMIKMFPERLSNYRVNIVSAIKGMINEMAEGQGREADLKRDIKLLCEKYGLSTDFLQTLPSSYQPPLKSWGWMTPDLICVNTSVIEVNDVFGASKLIYSITG